MQKLASALLPAKIEFFQVVNHFTEFANTVYLALFLHLEILFLLDVLLETFIIKE